MMRTKEYFKMRSNRRHGVLKVTVSDFGDSICVKVDDRVGAAELIIKLKPKVVER